MTEKQRDPWRPDPERPDLTTPELFHLQKHDLERFAAHGLEQRELVLFEMARRLDKAVAKLKAAEPA